VINPNYLYPFVIDVARTMVFVDGENLAIRYKKMLGTSSPSAKLTDWYLPDVAVWAEALNPNPSALSGSRVIRKYYYTSVQGDDDKVTGVADWLKGRGFEMPRVFKKDKERGSKQIDITLATDMLSHGLRHHYQIAVLVAGDEDYVPLIRAVKAEGQRVHVWFVSDGMSPRLRREADYFANIDEYLEVSSAAAK
jgi:uncharacterized LabA/DUF88 family protein